MGADGFFHSRYVTSDELVLSCYKLAKYYNVGPDTFLSKPLSELARAIKWTNMLVEQTTTQGE